MLPQIKSFYTLEGENMEETQMATTEPIRNPTHVHALLSHFKKNGQQRNYVLATLGIYTALRISDILNLRISDVFDLKTRKVKNEISITEIKTSKRKKLALHKKIKSALKLFLSNATVDAPLIINERTGKAISRVQAHRIISYAAVEVQIPYKVSCHSLRKTFGYFAWKNGTFPVILMAIFNHSSFRITTRYLGIQQDDQNAVYTNLRI